MFNRIIRREVQKEIDARLADLPKPVKPPVGYSTLEAIRGGMYHWILVPVNGRNVWMELRTSNSTQLDACGAVSLIEALQEKKFTDKDDIIETRNKMEEICKVTMNNPTFDQIIKLVTDSDIVCSEKRTEIERLKAIDITGMSATEKDYIDTQIYKHEMHLAFLLPEDTMDFIVRWALGADISDIKKLSHEQLLEASILASNGKDSPHKHLSGCFSDRDKSDIDKAAWVIYNEHMENKRIEKGIR